MKASAADARETAVEALARQIAGLGGGQRVGVFHLSRWSDRLLGQAMADPAFRTRLFRFVDAFPAFRGDRDVGEHLRAEFSDVDVPHWFAAGLRAARVRGLERVPAAIAQRTVDRMAHQFVLGTTPAEVAPAAARLWRSGTAVTVDVLGEHTHSEAEADRYAARLRELVEALAPAAARWPPDPLLEHDGLGPVPRVGVSVKVTALAPSFTPLTAEDGVSQVERRLLPVLSRAAELGVSVCVDMERYDVKALTYRLVRRLLDHRELDGLHAGTVVQAYLRDAADDLADLLSWAGGRRVPLQVRLVKGAYWDTETVQALAAGWPPPVFLEKGETDANFERLARTLLAHHGAVRAAFATHNVRSLAAAVVDARELGVPDTGYEVQLLHGMAEPVHRAVRRLGLRLRAYAPMGELVPGMAYLVRRLLENTSNEGFVRRRFAEGEDLATLIGPPVAHSVPGPQPQALRRATDPRRPGPYRPEPPAEWRRPAVLSSFGGVLGRELDHHTRRVTAVIGGEAVRTGRTLVSCDPSDPSVVVAEAAACGAAEARDAVAGALRAAGSWAATPMPERAAVLFRAAAQLRSGRAALAALEVREAGKGWADADADVCEAIDLCEYYGRRALRLAAGAEVQSPPGEENVLRYVPRGVCAVVSPWNFPLAIPAGMVAAALVTGNTVVLKPAEQTPAVAAELVSAFAAAGLPGAVLSFLPGTGEEAGAALVEHPGVDVVAFTGSLDVGLGIVEAAARRQPGRRSIARVIAELGGKNAVVVDGDADLDEVVPAVVASAFGFAGQKCSAASRMIALEPVYEEVLHRVVEATRSLVVAPPRLPGSQVGPVIDADAHARLRDAVARAGEAGRVVLARTDVPSTGWFVGPAVVAEVDPGSWLATEELFGPVLAAFCVPDLEAAVELANATGQALTAGVFSRSPDHVRRMTAALVAGNVYVNRAITGAVAGRQPFGGRGLSGVGSKAGGPDYLLQFCDAQVVSENTVRQGFAAAGVQPAASGDGEGPPAGGRHAPGVQPAQGAYRSDGDGADPAAGRNPPGRRNPAAGRDAARGGGTGPGSRRAR